MKKEQIIKMLPLTTGYCRDVKHYYDECLRLMSIREWLLNKEITSDARMKKVKIIINRIGLKLKLFSTNFKIWKKEIQELSGIICLARLGRIDFETKSINQGCTVNVCVDSATCGKKLYWHFTNRPTVRLEFTNVNI